jgi:dipeptide/tripeptide permease
VGAVRVLVPCLALAAAGYAILALGGGRAWLALSAVVFGLGFGSTYSVFLAYVMAHIDASRRAAAFGGVLAAVDTGIGTGSMLFGWVVDSAGFSTAYGAASLVAVLAIPYFLLVARRMLRAPRAD